MVFWDFIPADPKVEALVAIARALGILRDEINQNTKQHVIRYTKIKNGQQDIITLAANWEDAVQVLELPDCGDDKREIKRQLDELLDTVETPEQKQELRQRLESYLTERQRDFRKQGGEDSPRYLREKDIIQEFIAANKLGVGVISPESHQNPPVNQGFGFDTNPQPVDRASVSAERTQIPEDSPKFCGNCGTILRPNVRFCEQCGNRVGA